MPPSNPLLDNASAEQNQQNPLQQPQVSQQPSYQPPQQTGAAKPTSNSKKGLILTLILVVILVVFIGVAAYAYIGQIGPFARPPYGTDKLASSIFDGITQIKTSSYALSLNVVSQPRDNDAQPFQTAIPEDTKRLEAFKRDQDRVRTAQDVLRQLMVISSQAGKYPTQLQLTQVDSDPSYLYTTTNYGKDFAFSIQFETQDPIDAISRYNNSSSTTIVGKKVTLTKGSQPYFYMASEPKDPTLVNVGQLQGMLTYIPANFKFDALLAGASKKIDDKNIDGQIHVTANADISDMNFSVDAQFKKIADSYYIMVSKMPTLLTDISKIKDKWIKVTMDDLATYGQSSITSDPKQAEDEINATKEKIVEGVKLFLNIADRDQAIIASGTPVREDVSGVAAYRYEIGFNKANLVKFYTDITKEFQDKYADANPFKFDQTTLDYLNSPQYSEVFDYLRKNTTFTLWSDKDGVPVQAKYSIRVVPNPATGSARSSDKQVRLTITLSLKNINQPINIETPTGSMTFEDATIAMTGQSKEQYEFNKQSSAVSTVRSALERYKSKVSTYPSSLNELKKIDATDKQPILKAVPIDNFTKQPFIYSSSGVDYKLVYTQKLPPNKPGEVMSGIYSRDYANYKQNRLVVTYLDGQNTADAKNLSVEAAAASNIDSDKDGVPDALERYLGTNPNLSDTDHDGFSDYTELTSGTNPLGPGNLKTNYGYYGY